MKTGEDTPFSDHPECVSVPVSAGDRVVISCTPKNLQATHLPEPFLTIYMPGNLPRKSNSREIMRAKTDAGFEVVTENGRSRIVGSGRDAYRPISKKSPEAQQYVRDFCAQVPGYVKKAYRGPVAISATIAYRSKASDLSIELLMDAIQESGILANDNQIKWCVDVRGYVDPVNPGVLFSLHRIDEALAGPALPPGCGKDLKILVYQNPLVASTETRGREINRSPLKIFLDTAKNTL